MMRILIRPRRPTPSNAITVTPAAVRLLARPRRVLDFDIENRPLTYLGSDFTTAEVTAIAWAWTDARDVTCLPARGTTWTILTAFLRASTRRPTW
jgi:hypothetical protein